MSNNQNPAEHWRTHIKAWGASDLTQTKYCEQNGLKPFTFSYWKKKLVTPEDSALVEVTPRPPSRPNAALLEIRVSEQLDLSINLSLPGTFLGRLLGDNVPGR